jgi:menaquinone-dependent protoporphyrinogen oxidase
MNTMQKPILVTYATCTGTTQGVAQEIVRVLEAKGLSVENRPMVEVHDLQPYAAVVAGSAIQNRAWLPEAMDFIRRHQTGLRSLPCATFLVCMTLTIGEGKYLSGVKDWVQPVRSLVRPRAEGFFAGALDIGRLPSLGDRLKFRLSVLFGVWKEGDHRDWKQIREWAEQLPNALA